MLINGSAINSAAIDAGAAVINYYTLHAGSGVFTLTGGAATLTRYIPVRAAHRAPIGFGVRAAHRSPYALLGVVRAAHRSPYDIQQAVTVRAAHRSPYAITTRVVAAHRSPYDLAAYTIVRRAHRSPYAILPFPTQQVTGNLRIIR